MSFSDTQCLFLDLALLVEILKGSLFLHVTAVFGVGSSPALATCETIQVLLAGVSGAFPGVLPFRPTYRLARLYE